MMTQLPSVFELMVGTRGRQRSTSSLPTAPVSAAPIGQSTSKDEPSSPSSIPRISSATSLPSAISNFGGTAAAAAANGRKSSVHSIPEDPSSPANHTYRRRTEPNIFPHHHYLHQQHQQPQAQGPTSAGPAVSAPAPSNGSGAAPVPPSNTQTHLAPPPIFQHPSYNPAAAVFSPLASGPSPPNSTDYFTRNNQRSSISSSIDGLTRTNSLNGPLSLPTINGNANAQVYRSNSPKNEISPHQQHPHQPLQGLTAIPYQAEYFPVIYSSVPPQGGPPQSQVVYSVYPQPGSIQQYGGLGPPHQPQHPQHAHYQQHHPQQLQHLPMGHPHQIQSGDENNALVNKRRIIKRRTRSGCLTCRKRRIKCDERKPHCFNCERSKKVCLGYENVPKKKPGSQESDEEDTASHTNNGTGASNSGSNTSTPTNSSNSNDPIFIDAANYN
ncbi:hypothetical protein CLIB1423_01S05908 [[Candida] railenensis]|uniref:Zn(2)-C6 fungal-type domain-containing protein n=1 Tax=[Candida] railenensis TaxID=45579 RepID=A0A9P0QKV0_9ASCO|nr:hypothetical protein CLIB1423_01S05908 [[Candida] railenensis]